MKTDRSQERVLKARREVVHRLDWMRRAVHRESRWLPKGEPWLLPMVAFAVGLALAGKGGERRPSRNVDDGTRDA